MRNKVLLGSIAAAGIVHLSTLSLDSELLHWIFKLIPMALIIVLAALSPGEERRTSRYKKLILTGLAFSIGGDAFLLLPEDPWFEYGLGSFLIGHLFYVAAMTMRWLQREDLQGEAGGARRQQSRAIGFMAGIMIAGYSLVLGSRFYDSMQADGSQLGLWWPVVVYIAVIGAMGWSAIMSGNALAACGALLFMASDSILAWNKFVGDVPLSEVLIMATYFAAQLLIALSISRGAGARKA